MGTRLRLIGIVFGLSSLVLLGRLFFWQVLKADELSQQARLQHQSGEKISAQRGSILASDGTWLVASEESWLLWANTTRLKESQRVIANKLAPLLVEKTDDKEGLLKEAMNLEGLLSKDAQWIALKHKVTPEIKKNIEAVKIEGIGFDPEEKRLYPEASAAAQVLGFVGKDSEGSDRGYFGLEGYYDLPLSGKPGFLQRESDARGNPILSAGSKEVSAVHGIDLFTHIDKTIQLVVERELAKGIEAYGASAGTVIIMDSKDGAVLAMASSPSYDPEKYFEYGNEFFKNPAISDAFEPGSIFKPIVMAAALDAQVIKPDTKCDICDGPVKVDKYEIETWNKEYYPDSTMTDVIVHSDNVGMVFVGQKLGREKMFSYLTKFGIGMPSGIDLQGEANPGIRPDGKWNVVDLATTTFGQGIAVTPIQMIRAMAVIASGGEVMVPQIVDKIGQNGWEEDIKPEDGERVISEKAAQEITDMMVAAVKNGESKWTAAKGFKIAGKTGTAQIPVQGHYDEEKTIASFGVFAPADNPKFIMLVTLREPTSSPWGSETAAPLWFNIARQLFPYLGIQPES